MAGEANESEQDIYLRNLRSMERVIENNEETQRQLINQYSEMRTSSHLDREGELARIASEYEAADSRLFLLHMRAQKLREQLGLG